MIGCAFTQWPLTRASVTSASFPASFRGNETIPPPGQELLGRFSAWDRGRVNGIGPHPSGRAAVTVGSDRSAVLWDLSKGRKGFSLALPAEGRSVHFSPDGEAFFIVTDFSVLLYRGTTGDLHGQLSHASRVHAAAFIGNDWIVTGAEDCLLRLWDIRGDQPRCVIDLCQRHALALLHVVYRMLHLPRVSGFLVRRLRRVVATGHKHRIRDVVLLDASAAWKLPPAAVPEGAPAMSDMGRQERLAVPLSARAREDGRLLASADSDGIVKLWACLDLLPEEARAAPAASSAGDSADDSDADEDAGADAEPEPEDVPPLVTLVGARGSRVNCIAAAVQLPKSAAPKKRPRSGESAGKVEAERGPKKPRKRVSFGGVTAVAPVPPLGDKAKGVAHKKQQKGRKQKQLPGGQRKTASNSLAATKPSPSKVTKKARAGGKQVQRKRK